MSQRSPFNQRNMPTTSAEKKPSGVARRSASSAKPARQAASSVRVAKGTPSGKAKAAAQMTKEERKQARREERAEEDRVAMVSNLVLQKNPLYKSRRTVWWVLLGVGIVCTLLSFVFMQIPAMGSQTTANIGSMVTLALAYATIIAAFIYEFVKIRPLRNEALAKVKGMGERKRQAVVDANYADEERRRAQKAARKAARKSGK